MKSITRTPSRRVNDGESYPFSNLENIKHKDGNSASAYRPSSGAFTAIVLEDFNFNVPSGATIKKVDISYTASKSGSSARPDIYIIDPQTRRLHSQTYASGGFLSDVYETYTYSGNAGVVSDTFNLPLTPEKINSASFGIYVGFSAGGAVYVYLDHVAVTVYYEGGVDERVNEKSFDVSVYSQTGAYLTTLKEVVNDIEFTQEINTAGCTLTLELARNAGDYGEGTDIDFGYGVKVFCRDKEDPLGSCIFNGYISSYTPTYSKDTVTVVVTSYGDELDKFMLQEYVTTTSDDYTYWAVKGPYIANAPTSGDYTTERTFTVPSGCTQLQQIHLNIISTGAYGVEYALKRSGTTIATASQEYGNSNGTLLCDFITPVDVTAGESLTIEVTYASNTPLNAYTIYGNFGDGGIGYLLLSPDGTTEVAFLSADPGQIMRDIIEKYRLQGGVLDYEDSTIELTGTEVTYTFNANTTLEGVQKCVELAPTGWYWYVDVATNLVHFHQEATNPDHTFALEKHLLDAQFEKRIDELVNTVYFTGGSVDPDPPLYKKFTNTNSIQKYGIKAQKYIDQRVTLLSTAETIANSILEKRSEPELRVTLIVVDSNGTTNYGYDLESINVGDVVAVRNITQRVGLSTWDVARWDSDYWDFNIYNLSSLNMQILRLSYSRDKVTIYASTILPDVSKRIEDINRNLEASQTLNNPTNPT